jgi:hypothetical protein
MFLIWPQLFSSVGITGHGLGAQEVHSRCQTFGAGHFPAVVIAHQPCWPFTQPAMQQAASAGGFGQGLGSQTPSMNHCQPVPVQSACFEIAQAYGLQQAPLGSGQGLGTQAMPTPWNTPLCVEQSA